MQTNTTKEVPVMSSQDIELNKIPTSIQWDGWQAPTSFGLSLKNITKEKDEIKYLMDYTNNLFETKKTTAYLNENTPKLWFWKHVTLIFSIGVVYEEEDKQILDAILKYFNKKDDVFIPNNYKLFDYRNELIKTIEKEFDIGPGNYHFMLVPFVTTDDKEILKDAPESVYSAYGPLTPFVDLDNAVSYIIEINNKYGAVKSGMTEDVAKILHINLNKDIEDQNPGQSGTYGQARKMTYDPMNRRIQRQGYIDFATGDGITSVEVGQDLLNLMNPEQQIDPTLARQWFDENQEGLNYRHAVKPAHRDINGLDCTPPEAFKDQRFQGKNSLYNQIARTYNGMDRQHLGIIPDQKAIHYKADDYYETESNKEIKPSYELYDIEYSTKDLTEDEFKKSMNKFVDEQKGKTEVPKALRVSSQPLNFNIVNKPRLAGSINFQNF